MTIVCNNQEFQLQLPKKLPAVRRRLKPTTRIHGRTASWAPSLISNVLSSCVPSPILARIKRPIWLRCGGIRRVHRETKTHKIHGVNQQSEVPLSKWFTGRGSGLDCSKTDLRTAP